MWLVQKTPIARLRESISCNRTVRSRRSVSRINALSFVRILDPSDTQATPCVCWILDGEALQYLHEHPHMNILKRWIWPIAAGFIVASIIMLIFEWINHFIFPLPVGLDQHDTAAVQAFTASLPWTAYILVFLGWA